MKPRCIAVANLAGEHLRCELDAGHSPWPHQHSGQQLQWLSDAEHDHIVAPYDDSAVGAAEPASVSSAEAYAGGGELDPRD